MFALGLSGVALAHIVELGTNNQWDDLPAALEAVRDYPAGPAVTLELQSGAWGGDGVVQIQNLQVELVLDDATGAAELPLLRIVDEIVTLRSTGLAPDAFFDPAIEVEGSTVTLDGVTGVGPGTGLEIFGGSTVTVLGGTYRAFGNHVFDVEGSTLVLGGGVVVNENGGLGTGAIAAREGATVEIGVGTYEANFAGFGVGGLLSAVSSTVIVRGGAVISGNTAVDGGAVHCSACGLTVEPGALFVGNSASANGGAIQATSGTLVIDGAIFTDNRAGLYGGALTLYDLADGVVSGSTFDGTDAIDDEATFGGGAILASGVTNLVCTANVFASIGVGGLGSGGAVVLSGGDAKLVDTVAGDVASGLAGGFAAVDQGTLSLVGGTFTSMSSGSGAVVYGTGSTVTLDGVVAAYPYVYLTGGLAAVEGGALTVRGSLEIAGSGTSALGLYATGASVEVSDSAFVDNVAWGGGGTITLDDNVRADLTRVALCGNADPYLHPAIHAIGALNLRSSRIWNNLGGTGAVGVYAGSGTATIEHTTFADNGILSVYAKDSAVLAHNLFAPGLGNVAAYFEQVAPGAGSGPNYVEAGAYGEYGGADLGFVEGTPIFQETRPFSCASTLFVSWDDPVAVDWAASSTGGADLDGTAPDFGAFGGPVGWPADTWDVDADGNRNDLDCAPEDGTRFYGNPDGNGDCACDGDGDGWFESWCLPGGIADCDDGDATLTDVCDGTGPGCDSDGDGFTGRDCGGDDCDDDNAGIHPEALDLAGDAIDADCDGDATGGTTSGGLLTFGGGGCATGPGPGWLAWPALLLVGRVRTRRSAVSAVSGQRSQG